MADEGDPDDPNNLVRELRGETVVVDLTAPYVCIGTLSLVGSSFFELRDADLHDFRDGRTTREIYVYDAARLGVRRNRSRVLIRAAEVVAITRLDEILED